MDLDIPPRAEVLEYLLSFDLYEQLGNQAEGIAYARRHVDRFLKTLEYVPELARGAGVLELGASPYFMSLIIMKYLGYEITPANYFGDYGEKISGPHRMTVSSKRFGESHTFDSQFFNVEADRYPYADAQFDVVLCCEILEHLARDPTHLLREAHRILRPGGYLVLSTPNAVRLENLVRMVRGKNIHAAYSGYGVYGRHNREYSRGELDVLLHMNHFEPRVIVDNAYSHHLPYRLATAILRGRRDNLFAVGRKVGQTVQRRPSWLFEHDFGLQRARTSYVVMGDEEHDQLGHGWSEFEYGPPGRRWVDRRANVLLLPTGGESRVRFHADRPLRAVSGRLLVNGAPAGGFDLLANEAKDITLAVPQAALAELRAGECHYFDVAIEVDGPGEKILPIVRMELTS